MTPAPIPFTGPDEIWAKYARCREPWVDPDNFYAEREGGATYSPPKLRKAVSCCMRCQVRPECLRHAIVNCERWGVWGGMRDMERREVIDLTRRHPDLIEHIIDEALVSSEAKAREEGLA